MLLKINLNCPLSFNHKAGINEDTQRGADQVMIITPEGEGKSYSLSKLQAILGTGSTYSIPKFNGTSKTLTVMVNNVDLTFALLMP